jgi:hypothetical protein
MLNGYSLIVCQLIGDRDAIDNVTSMNDDFGNSADGQVFGPFSDIR